MAPAVVDWVAVATNSAKIRDLTVYQAQHSNFVVVKHSAAHCSIAQSWKCPNSCLWMGEKSSSIMSKRNFSLQKEETEAKCRNLHNCSLAVALTGTTSDCFCCCCNSRSFCCCWSIASRCICCWNCSRMAGVGCGELVFVFVLFVVFPTAFLRCV